MAILSIMIGIPGSGKSTIAKELSACLQAQYISSDDIRKELYGFEDQTQNAKVFDTMNNRTIKLLRDDISVIYDATNLSAKRRMNLINYVQNKIQNVEFHAYLCCVGIDTILERNLIRPERKLPWDKLELFIRSIEVPMFYEGFDKIYLMDGGMYDDIDYDNLIQKCVDYPQNNPYHTETLQEHIDAVTKRARELGEQNLILKTDRWILCMAAKFHDFGKLYTKQYSDKKGYYVYYGHEKVSAYLYLCHIRKQRMLDEFNRVSLWDSDAQITALILYHMEWYRREDMATLKEMFNDNDLFKMLELLHKADIDGRGKDAKSNY